MSVRRYDPWYYGLGAYGVDFVQQPSLAYLDFACVGALVHPSLAARLKLEMLDHAGHVNTASIRAKMRWKRDFSTSEIRPGRPLDGRW
jgi:hypothetical protein